MKHFCTITFSLTLCFTLILSRNIDVNLIDDGVMYPFAHHAPKGIRIRKKWGGAVIRRLNVPQRVERQGNVEHLSELVNEAKQYAVLLELVASNGPCGEVAKIMAETDPALYGYYKALRKLNRMFLQESDPQQANKVLISTIPQFVSSNKHRVMELDNTLRAYPACLREQQKSEYIETEDKFIKVASHLAREYGSDL